MAVGDVTSTQKLAQGYKAVVFSGVANSTLEITNSEEALFHDFNKDFTIDFKVKMSHKNIGNTGIGSKWQSTGNNCCWRIYLDATGKLNFGVAENGVNGTGITLASSDITDNLWHSFIATRRGTLITLYSDGISVGNGNVTLVKNGIRTIVFGRIQGMPFDYGRCQIADIRFYNKALSSAEIEDRGNNLCVRDGLIAVFNFLDGTYNNFINGSHNGTGVDTHISICETNLGNGIKGLRNGVNDKWLIVKGMNGDLKVVNIEE
jgi:hypothetical protein